MEENVFGPDEWKIVKARIEAMPANLKLSIGGIGSFSKQDLIKHIEDKDQIGELLVRAHFNYLRSFKKEASMLTV